MINPHTIRIATALLTLAYGMALLTACRQTEESIEAGAICTLRDADGSFRVAKVLVINPEQVHLMVFKNVYRERPAEIGPEDLKLSEVDDTEDDQSGFPHVALSRQEFDDLMPVIVAFEQVVEEDLRAYNAWKAAQENSGEKSGSGH